MATQCNAMQTVSSKLPSTFCRVDPGGKMSPHPPGLSKQVSPQTMDCAKQKKTLHSVLSYPFVINMFHSHRPQLQKDTSRTLPESIVPCRADFRHLARPGIFRKRVSQFPMNGTNHTVMMLTIANMYVLVYINHNISYSYQIVAYNCSFMIC